MDHNVHAIMDNHMAPTPPLPDSMQGWTSLATAALRVQQSYDSEIEQTLLPELLARRDGTPDDRRRLGDPSTIVLESEAVIRLAARLSSAPWADVLTAASDSDSQGQAGGIKSALLLLASLLASLHDIDAAVGTSGQPSAHVLQSFVQQVCSPCVPTV